LPTDLGIGEGTSGDPPFDALFVLPCRLRRIRRIKDLHVTGLKTVLTAIFFENVFPLKNKEKLLHESSIASNKFVDDVQELRRSKRARKERNFGNNFIAYIVDDDPTCYCEAIKFI
jgi:hypothetical protein